MTHGRNLHTFLWTSSFLSLMDSGFCSQGQLLPVINQSIDVRFQLLGHGLLHLLRKIMIRDFLLKLRERNRNVTFTMQ